MPLVSTSAIIIQCDNCERVWDMVSTHLLDEELAEARLCGWHCTPTTCLCSDCSQEIEK